MNDNEIAERLKRISEMEQRFDEAALRVSALMDALERYNEFMPETEKLIAYYDSDMWRSDFNADEQGLIPEDMKRGVLSEDGIYNLISDIASLNDEMKRMLAVNS